MKLYQRDPIFRCWRIQTIKRCVLRYGKPKSWALDEARKVSGSNFYDDLIENWFIDMDWLRQQKARKIDDACEIFTKKAA